MTVKIGEIEYTIVFERLEDDVLGEISHSRAKISISDAGTFTPDTERLTVCHEIAHAMCRVISTDNEKASEALGHALLQFVRKNKEVIKYLQKEKARK